MVRRTIDADDLHNKVMLNKSDWGIFATQIDNLIESIVMQTPTAEAIPKDQYETRLKADMVALLTEIQLEIEELDPSGNEWSDSLDACNDIIQQKINALKGE